MNWLQTARDVVARHGATFVYVDTGEPIGPAKSEVLMRDYEQETEVTIDMAKADRPRRIKSSRRTLLDMTTASMLCQIYDALNVDNKAKFAALPLLKAVSVGWKLCK